ncbi:hypothetical protein ACFX2J_022084 [Malus domestica]
MVGPAWPTIRSSSFFRVNWLEPSRNGLGLYNWWQIISWWQVLKKIERPAVADFTNQYFEQSGLCLTSTMYHVMQFIDSSTKRLFNRSRLLIKSFSKKRSCWWIRSFAIILVTILHYPFIENSGVSVRDFKTAKLIAEINFPFLTSRACGLRCHSVKGILRLWHTLSYVLNRQIGC